MPDLSTSLSVDLPAVAEPLLQPGARVACLRELRTTPVVSEMGIAIADSGADITAHPMSSRDHLGHVVSDVDGHLPGSLLSPAS